MIIIESEQEERIWYVSMANIGYLAILWQVGLMYTIGIFGLTYAVFKLFGK